MFVVFPFFPSLYFSHSIPSVPYSIFLIVSPLQQVLDITVSSAERIESPESWMLQVLSREDTTVLLVISPALAALHKSLQPNGTAAYVSLLSLVIKVQKNLVLLPETKKTI